MSTTLLKDSLNQLKKMVVKGVFNNTVILY